MRRMTLAIERAIKLPTSKEKERAARWAAAWGLLCGIQTRGVKLKACDIQTMERRIEQGLAHAFTLASSSTQSVPDPASAALLTAHATVDRSAQPSP